MKLYNLQGKLNPVAPFNFSLSLNFISMFPSTQNEQTISNISLTKAVYLKNRTLAFKLINEGTTSKPILSYTIYSTEEINEEIKIEFIDRIKFYLSLDDNLKSFYAIGKKDPYFKSIINDLYGLHQVKFLTPFEAAAWAVLSQRINMKAAHSMKDKITEAFGDNIQVEGVDYWTFPSPNQIKKLDIDELQSLIKNKRKSEYLLAVASAFDEIDEKFLRQAPIDEVREWLLNIKGIGDWSAHLELIRGLGRMGELSEHTDRMLVTCARKFYGPNITEKEINKIGESYGDYRGYWEYYLRIAC